MLRIAFLTSTDPLDLRSWSGTPCHMFRALESRGCDVTALGPLHVPERQWLRVYGRLRGVVRTDKYLHGHSARFARACGRAAERKLAGAHFDVILAPAASAVIAHLTTDIPIVYVSDATFALMLDYNPDFTDVCESTRRDGEAVERLAIERASAVSYPSEWAAASAERDYGAAREKTHVIPFGVNLESVPDRDRVLSKKRSERIRLLLVGRNWERKGGDVAVEALAGLRRQGIDATLTVCGCVPPRGVRHPGLRVIPFLDKSDPEQLAELRRLYLSADILVLPTQNECFGVVVAEANAFGVPAIVADTGGLHDVVRDGRNGYALPPAARGEDYARVVRDLWRDRERYSALSRTSRDEYEARLNWGAWAAAMIDVFSSVSGRE